MMGVAMIDTQILTIAMSTAPTMLIVLVGILINNARLGDVKEILRAETRAEISALRVEINERFNVIENKLDTILRLLADLDQRVTRLEARS